MKSVSSVFTSTRSWVALLAFSVGLSVQGQNITNNPGNDDDNIASSIAPYPSDVRDAILDVSQYPQKLIQVERLQARSSQAFQDLLSRYPRDVQEKFYDISRYPDLVAQLAVNGDEKSPDQVKRILSAYPAKWLRAQMPCTLLTGMICNQ